MFKNTHQTVAKKGTYISVNFEKETDDLYSERAVAHDLANRGYSSTFGYTYIN